MTPPDRLAGVCERAAMWLAWFATSDGQPQSGHAQDAAYLTALATALRWAYPADPDIHGRQTSYVVNLGET